MEVSTRTGEYLFQCADFSVFLMLYLLPILLFETSKSSQLIIFLLSEDNKNTNKIVIMIIV